MYFLDGLMSNLGQTEVWNSDLVLSEGWKQINFICQSSSMVDLVQLKV
jgi:hypothetical protein